MNRVRLLGLTLAWVLFGAGVAAALSITSVQPAQNALHVPGDANIVLSFDQTIDQVTVDSTTVIVRGNMSGLHPGTLTVTGAQITFDPAEDFAVGDLAMVVITRGVKSVAGDSLVRGFCWYFTVAAAGGTGVLEVDSIYPGENIPYYIYGGDLDGDGDMDIATPNEGSQNVSIYFNNGDGTFGPLTEYPSGTLSSSVYGDDFDNDGDQDLAVANKISNDVSVLLNNGDGTFAPQTLYDAGFGTQQITGGDFDNDGDIDIVTSQTGSNNLAFFFHDGARGYDSVAYLTYPGADPNGIFGGDFNGDGRFDVAAGNFSFGTLTIVLGGGDGTFAAGGSYPIGSSIMMYGGDLDGDGDLDIVATRNQEAKVTFAFNDGNGGFDSTTVKAAGTWPLAAWCGDLDGDGDLDAMVSNFSSGDLSLYMNQGDGTFEDQRVFDMTQSGSFVWFHDLDGDGDLDVSAVDELADELYIFLNRNQCHCPCHADPECDGSLNDTDILAATAAAFRSIDPVADADCPMARADIDCDGSVTVHDVIWFVDEVHRGGGTTAACDGCGGVQDPPCSPIVAGSGNSVLVESRTVLPGATGIQIGVFIENAVDLTSIVLPLEIREVTPGAFTVGAPVFGVSGRLIGSGMEDLPTAIQTLSPSTGHSCSGPVSRTWSLSSGPGGQGSPDGFLYVGLATTSGCWPAGSDGLLGTGTPSLIFTFDVDTVIGSFIIDTSCWAPENHLVFLECTANRQEL